MILRKLIAAFVVPLLVSLAVPATGQEPSLAESESAPYVSIGVLAKVQGPGGPGYVLRSESGDVLAKLKQAAGVGLDEFVGHEVGVTVRTLVDGDTPVLLAESVTSFRVSDTIRDDQVTLASAQQEALPQGIVVPEDVGPIEYEYATPVDGPLATGGGLPVTSTYLGGGVPCQSCGSSPCQVGCSGCRWPGNFWIRAEYLAFWTKGMNTPPLVTSSPAGTPAGNAGVLGTPGVGVLYGGDELFTDARSGARFRIGKGCDDCGYLGFETDFLFLGEESQNYYNCDIGPQIVARPFQNTEDGADSQLVQYPGIVNGAVSVEAETSLWSIGPRFRFNLSCEQMPGQDPYYPCAPTGYRFDALLGYRYVRLDDRLAVRESLATVDPNDPTFFELHDSFDTSNDFHGVDVGIIWEGYRGPWSLELVSRLGLGNTHQQVTIDGATTASDLMGSVTDPGGLLTQTSNIGKYSRDEFTVIPEIGLTLGYSISPRTRFMFGYTLLYWDKVVRAGEVIDTTVNPALIPGGANNGGPQRPAFAFTETDFWAQGLSFGLDYRW